MFLLVIAIYFGLASIAVAIFAFPAFRLFLLNRCKGLCAAAAASSASLGVRAGKASDGCLQFVSQNFVGFAGILRKYRVILIILSVIVALPPLVAVLLNQHRVLDYVDTGYSANERITMLLKGEQLVPPAPLPPEIFVTREVELVRPALASASRDWSLLDADFRLRLLHVFKVMKEAHGYDMALLEGYRSPERQASLQASGAGVVTNAGAYQSYHQYGLAADVAFLREGKLVISERDPWAMRGYQLYGQEAENIGLTWGGRWKLMDFGHAELRRANVLGKRN